MTQPTLSLPPEAIYDPAKVRLGDGFISAKFPSRRALLRSTALFPVALAAASCQTVSDIVAITPKIASYIDTIAKVAAVVTPVILGLTKLSTNVKDTIASALAAIETSASSIASATSTTTSGLVAKLTSGVGTIAGLLSGVGVPSVVTTFIQNAVALVPAIEAAVGIKTTTHAARFAATVSPDQAHANLQAVLHR